MNSRLILLLALLPAIASAQAPAPPAATPAAPPPVLPQPATIRVALMTSEGPIVIAVETERAPITAANFLRYVDGKRLDNTEFYRTSKVAPNFGFIQGGLRNDPKKLLPPIAHEPTTKSGLTHADGTISMARNAPGSATMDFFITLGAIPSMDADPKLPGDNQGFAAFGRVVEGMETVRRILDAQTSPTEGEGVMRGQMLAAPVKILTARRAPPTPAAAIPPQPAPAPPARP
ncbi:peptidylprolyl isomerase [Sphingomonas sp. 1P06PA]|uniref:peptidylprolyl isomerase n=1 Tax=Sphingomonas sp. 1P06PA TaxID=554121 RepID=UPI0039A69428